MQIQQQTLGKPELCTGANGALPSPPAPTVFTCDPVVQCQGKVTLRLNPFPVLHANKSQSRLILFNTEGNDQAESSGAAALDVAWLSEVSSMSCCTVMAVKIHKSFFCMWHVCACCWLKVVVIIAGLKLTGGGCVPLIPYLISRSRGEALNPKHTHTLSRSLTNVSTYSQRMVPPLHTPFRPTNWCCSHFTLVFLLNTVITWWHEHTLFLQSFNKLFV